MKPLLTPEDVRALFVYDAATGVLTWRHDRGRKVKAGARAGSVDSEGYVRVKMHGQRWTVHQLAWMYVHGKKAEGQIDHFNGDRADNRMSNLRDVTVKVNTQNQRKPQSRNKSGFLGVMARRGKFRARITVDARPIYLGSYETPEEAHAAYVAAKRKYHQGCTL